MKKSIILIASLFIIATAQAQTKAVKGADGNYTVKSHRDTSGKSTGTPTGHTITDSKGNVYPLLKSINDKLYYLKTSRNGNVYKVYVKESKD